jgi:DNA-directed RNA polymerase subunit M/transcription elongation factor TFIIS
MVVNKFKIKCKDCGFEEVVVHNEHRVIPMGIYFDRKEYAWTGCSTKEEYEKKLKKLEQECKKDKNAEYEFKKEKSLQKTRKEENIQTFKCPKCGKEKLHWELLKSAET